jgi:hypothetical protein
MPVTSKKKNRSGSISSFSSRKKTRTHLYTKGGEFSLDGKNYIGEYYIEGDSPFTGPTPVDINEDVNRVGDPDLVNPKIRLVTPKAAETGKLLRRVYPEDYQYEYERIKAFNIPILNFIDPIPYLYEPKDSAYGVGEDVRYFVQKRGNDDSYAIEIDSKQWEMIGGFRGIDDGLYAFIGVTWKLVGAYDIVAQQNELALFKAQKVIPSILYSVKSFTEFARFKRF